jgi:hypothetical protein
VSVLVEQVLVLVRAVVDIGSTKPARHLEILASKSQRPCH